LTKNNVISLNISKMKNLSALLGLKQYKPLVNWEFQGFGNVSVNFPQQWKCSQQWNIYLSVKTRPHISFGGLQEEQFV